MSDLSLQLQPATSQLPVSVYFDEALLAREKQALFAQGPRYLGHRLLVPEQGDYFALPQEGEGRALIHTPRGIELVSNICRHRQAVMLKGRGQMPAETSGSLICPVHRWTYAADGKQPTGTLIGAPHFPHDPCLHLNNYRIKEWNGLLFEDNGRDVAADLAALGAHAELDFSGYALGHIELHQCNYNWKTFIEVYLEDYHVVPFHPGLGNFVTCDDLRWEFTRNASVQTVGINGYLGRAGRAGSPVYRKWQEELLKYRNNELPERGAIWLTYYPHIMVEWYPHVLTISTVHPISPTQTLNAIEFFYPEDIVAFEPEFMKAQQAAYMETCIEDDEIAERMDAGRRALFERGDNEAGPYQSPMEDGMQHFHEWYRQQMQADDGTLPF